MIYDDDCLVMNATTSKGLNGEAVVGRGSVNRRQNQVKDETQKRRADNKRRNVSLCVCT